MPRGGGEGVNGGGGGGSHAFACACLSKSRWNCLFNITSRVTHWPETDGKGMEGGRIHCFSSENAATVRCIVGQCLCCLYLYTLTTPSAILLVWSLFWGCCDLLIKYGPLSFIPTLNTRNILVHNIGGLRHANHFLFTDWLRHLKALIQTTFLDRFPKGCTTTSWQSSICSTNFEQNAFLLWLSLAFDNKVRKQEFSRS